MQRFFKQFLTFGTLLYSLAMLFLVVNGPATGYEISIYKGIHKFVGIGLSGAMIIAILTLLYGGRQIRRKGVWLLGAVYWTILSLPILRGYLLYASPNADVLAHIGSVRDIIQQGYIAPNNIYPGLHLLGTILSFFGVPILRLRFLWSIVFTGLLVTGIGLLARRLDNRTTYIALAAIAPFFYGKFYLTVQPAVLSVMLIPMILLAYIHYRIHRNQAMLWVIGLLHAVLITYHIMTAIFAIGLLFFTELLISKKLPINSTESYPIPIAVGITTILWILTVVESKIILLLSSLFARPAPRETSDIGAERAQSGTSGPGEHEGILDLAIGEAVSGSLDMWEFVTRAIELYGILLLNWALGLLSVLIILYIAIKRKPPEYSRFAIVLWLYGALLVVPYLFFPIVTRNPYRAGRVLILATVVVFVIAFISLGGINRRRLISVTRGVLAVVLVVATPLGFYTMFEPQYHLNEETVEGSRWVVEHDSGLEIYALDLSPKLEMLFRGKYAVKTGFRHFRNHWNHQNTQYFPKHLGYSDGGLSSRLENGLLYTRIANLHIPKLHEHSRLSEFTYYTDGDVVQLAEDPAVDKIYTTGSSKIWRT